MFALHDVQLYTYIRVHIRRVQFFTEFVELETHVEFEFPAKFAPIHKHIYSVCSEELQLNRVSFQENVEMVS